MINFRFHVVSLTAVFLAFAVGLVLGTSFLDDATERTLKRQLDDLRGDLGDARENNTELQGRLDRLAEEDQRFDEELGQRLLTDTLADVPVLVIAPQGLEGDAVDLVTNTLEQANANLLGTWQLTDRLLLDDEGEVQDLAGILNSDTDDVGRLRGRLSADLGAVLEVAIQTADGSDAGATLSEPPLLGELVEGNFVDYQMPEGYEPPEGEDPDVVLLPSSGLRVVIVTGTGAIVPDGDLLQPMVVEMTADGPQPLVVATRTPAEGDETAVDGLDPLVAAIRGEDALSDAVSTVDNLEMVSGRLATALALQEAVPEAPVVGQYGIGAGAESLLPPPPQ